MSAPPCTSRETCIIYYAYHYTPSIPGAAYDAFAFALVAGLLTWQTYRYSAKGLRYMWWAPIMAAAEAIGYATRAYTVSAPSIGPLVVSQMTLLLAPIFQALVLYVVVGKLFTATGRRFGCLPARWVSRAFLASDVMCLAIQGNGSAILSLNRPELVSTANAIVLTGLAIQLLFFLCFLALIVYLHVGSGCRLVEVPALRPVFTGVYVIYACLFVRTVYRLAEYAGGATGPIATRELWFGLFESMPIFWSFCAMSFWHFGRLLGAANDPATLLAWLTAVGTPEGAAVAATALQASRATAAVSVATDMAGSKPAAGAPFGCVRSLAFGLPTPLPVQEVLAATRSEPAAPAHSVVPMLTEV